VVNLIYLFCKFWTYRPFYFGSPSSFGLAGICHRQISGTVFSLFGSKFAVYATENILPTGHLAHDAWSRMGALQRIDG